MTEPATESSANHSVRFPYLVASEDIPFFQLAATAIPGIDAITHGKPKTADSKFVPIEITGPNITESTIPLLAYTGNFLSGESDKLRRQGVPQEKIDAKLKQVLDDIIARKLPKQS